MELSFSNKSFNNEPKSGMKLTELNNVKISNNLTEVRHFSGTYFPARYRHQYTSLLHDYIGGYLQLKKIYPELKIIFFQYDQSEYNIHTYRNELVVKDFVKYFDAEVINIDQIDCTFDKVILHEAEIPPFKLPVSGIEKPCPEEFSIETIVWRTNSIIELIDEFKKYLIDKNNRNNIYITRSKINEHWLKSTHKWHVNFRSHDAEHDNKLDNLFLNNKYDIHSFYDIGFFEQINIAYNSKIYATIDGSGLMNSIWCKPDTKIIQIQINKEYKKFNYYWREKLKSANKKIFKTIDVTETTIDDGISIINNEIKLLDW